MSHTTTLNTLQIKDVRALNAAVQDLQKQGVNCKLIENEKPRMYYAKQADEVGVCDYVLRLSDSSYDVGLQRNEEGVLVPVFDSWNGDVQRQVGAVCNVPVTDEESRAARAIGNLSQQYGVHAAIYAAQDQGYQVIDTSRDADGTIHINIQT